MTGLRILLTIFWKKHCKTIYKTIQFNYFNNNNLLYYLDGNQIFGTRDMFIPSRYEITKIIKKYLEIRLLRKFVEGTTYDVHN